MNVCFTQSWPTSESCMLGEGSAERFALRDLLLKSLGPLGGKNCDFVLQMRKLWPSEFR